MLRVRHPVAGGVLPDSRVGFEVGDRGKHGGSAELLRAVWAVDGYGGGRVALPGEGYQQRRGLRVGFAAAVRGQPAVTTGSTENRAYNVALRDNQSIKKQLHRQPRRRRRRPLPDINVAIHNVIWVMKSGSVVVDKTSPTPH